VSEKKDLRAAMKLIGKKWSPLIIHSLSNKGRVKFTDLKKDLGDISNKVLSSTLDSLVENELVEREETEEGTYYALTGKGAELEEPLEMLADWHQRASQRDKNHVLVVEDNEAQAALYGDWLSSEYVVTVANTREELFNSLSDSIDLILLDRKLGRANARELLEDDRIRSKPVILLSAMNAETEIIDMDIENYIVKPSSREELSRKVRQTLKDSEKHGKMKELSVLHAKRNALKDSGGDLDSRTEYEELEKKIDELRKDIDKNTEMPF
jgi:DNA-binding HxlR family transcriptional regulator